VRENFRRFQQLSPERREALREQWRRATPAQRQQWLQRMRENPHEKKGEGHAMGGAPHSPPPRPH
jgi:hypothetical protein